MAYLTRCLIFSLESKY